MKHIKKMKIDIDKSNFEVIPSVQYDSNTRFLHINLLNGAVPFNLTGCSVKISGTKPDGTAIFNNCTVINAKEGFIEVELTEQMNAAPGTLKCELKLYNGSGVLTTKHFEIEVTKSVTSKTVVSSNEFKALEEALSKVNDIDTKFEALTSEVVKEATEKEIQKQIALGNIPNLTIANNSMDGEKIKDGTVTKDKLDPTIQFGSQTESYRINCNSSLLTYGTGWVLEQDESAYLGNVKVANNYGATVSFKTSKVAKLGIVCRTSPTCGNVVVYVNGNEYGEYSCYSKMVVNQNLIATIDLKSENNDIKLVTKTADGRKVFVLDYIAVTLDLKELYTTKDNNTMLNPSLIQKYERRVPGEQGALIPVDSDIITTKNCTIKDDTDSISKKMLILNKTYGYIRFPFRGTGIEIYDITDSNRGVMKISIDGISHGEYNRSKESRDYDKISIMGLDETEHNAEINLVSGSMICLCGFIPIASYASVIEDIANLRPFNKKDNTSLEFWIGTQAEYDSIKQKESTTLYFIKEE